MRATFLNTNRQNAGARGTVGVRAIAVALALITLVAATPALSQAQNFATAIGSSARGSVRTTARFTLPEILVLREAAPAAATWQGERFTEYLIKYTVAANVQWEVSAERIPAGVTLLSEAGTWVDASATNVVVERGAAGNATEVLVRVRVADGGAVTWAQDLQLEARRR